MKNRSIALFGGTFDPIHLGHTRVAAFAAEKISADKVIFIPAKQSPLKKNKPAACDHHRLAMVRLAIADKPRFEVSDYELRKQTQSYTIETVEYFRQSFGPDVAISWLAGADSMSELPRWHRIKELIDICDLRLMYRPGCERPNFDRFTTIWGRQRVRKLNSLVIPTPLIDISATEIRNRLAAGQSVHNMLQSSVYQYIQASNLYRKKAE